MNRDKEPAFYQEQSPEVSTIDLFIKNFESLAKSQQKIIIEGRVISIKKFGKIAFIKISRDFGELQAILNKNEKGCRVFFNSKINIGDIVSVSGTASKNNKIPSLYVTNFLVLSKCLKILPKIIKDESFAVKHRYLDLIINPEVKDRFTKCSILIMSIREFLKQNNFLEFDTGILKSEYDGGDAKPFITHHNALDMNFYLRITMEVQLKQLLIGGYDKVFELSKSFRNEGIDHFHYPEFNLLELYSAYTDISELLKLLPELIKYIATTLGVTELQYMGNTIKILDEWDTINVPCAFKKYADIDIDEVRKSEEKRIEISKELGYKETQTLSVLLHKIITEKIQPNLIKPTFLTDIPIELSPFAKPKMQSPMYAERAWLYILGFDICDVYSDLNDVDAITKRFEDQDKQTNRNGGYSHKRSDFIESLSYGMPPSAGFGMSVSRLQMLFTNSRNIRDVILFPHGV